MAVMPEYAGKNQQVANRDNMQIDVPEFGEEYSGVGPIHVATTNLQASLSVDDNPAMKEGGYSINWGDGTVDEGVPADLLTGRTHTYTAGTYVVTITGGYGYKGKVTGVTVSSSSGSHTYSGSATVAPDPADLFVNQQWRDVEKSGDYKRNPLAVNRDTRCAYDPFD